MSRLASSLQMSLLTRPRPSHLDLPLLPQGSITIDLKVLRNTHLLGNRAEKACTVELLSSFLEDRPLSVNMVRSILALGKIENLVL